MSTLQTCGMCGHTGPVRYDNRKNRRCENCWERVESLLLDDPNTPIVAGTDDGQAAPPTTTVSTETTFQPAPTKTKKGK